MLYNIQTFIATFGCESSDDCDVSLYFAGFCGTNKAVIVVVGKAIALQSFKQFSPDQQLSQYGEQVDPAWLQNKDLIAARFANTKEEIEVDGFSIDLPKSTSSAAFAPISLTEGSGAKATFSESQKRLIFDRKVVGSGILSVDRFSTIYIFKGVSDPNNPTILMTPPLFYIARCANGKSVTLEIEPIGYEVDDLERTIIIKVTSDMVIVVDKQFEKPDNFPNENMSYSNGTIIPEELMAAASGEKPYAVVQRLHYAGFLNKEGRYYPDTTAAEGFWEQPFSLSQTYHPKYKASITPPSDDSPQYANYVNIDMDAIKEYLINKYPGIEGLS